MTDTNPPPAPGGAVDSGPATEALFDNSALDDAPPTLAFARPSIDSLRHPSVVRSLLIIAIALLVVFWPERSNRILAALIGLGLIVVSATSVWVALRRRPRALLVLATSVIGFASGTFLLISPDRSETFLGRLIGLVLAIAAIRDLVRDLRADQHDTDWPWLATRTIAQLGVAGVLIAFPTQLVSALSTVVALGWFAFAVLVIVVSLDQQRPEVAGYADSGELVLAWLTSRPKSLDDREALYNKVLFDGPSTAKRVVRFFTLMTFASVIASMGIIADSTAVVIGAMLIAPLMTPLMGMAVSLAMGWPRRLGRSALVAFGGIACTVIISALLGLLAPRFIDVATNSQIVSRSTPTVLDLVIAIAAGAAGAYGLSRPDVSDSLPGVAIAIALVPPLAAVGVASSLGEWEAASGALLLFSTNMIAILVVGGITFVFTGVVPVQRLAEGQQRVRTAVATVAAVGAVVLGLLFLNGAQAAANLLNESSVEDAVAEWMIPHTDHGVVGINVDDDTVSVTIIGPADAAPRAVDLATLLDAEFGRTMTADVRLIVEEREIATSGTDE